MTTTIYFNSAEYARIRKSAVHNVERGHNWKVNGIDCIRYKTEVARIVNCICKKHGANIARVDRY